MAKRVLWFLGLWMYLSFLAVCITHAQNPQTQNAPIYAVNSKYANGTAPGYWPTQLSIANGSGGTIAAATGLNINVGPGTANCGSGNIFTYVGGTKALSASATNRIYLDTTSSCVVSVKTTAFVGTDIPIATVVTNGSGVTSVSDLRTWANVPPSTSSTSVSSNDGSVIVTIGSGNADLHVLTTQCYLGDGGLAGSLTNSSGVVKLPLCIGKGPASFTVPIGADRLKLGINDDLFVDNIGSFTVNVSKNGGSPSSVVVAGNVMPWSPTTNPAFTFGVNDGASPVDAITGLTPGDVITVTYVSGTVKMNSTYPNVDADGYLTDPPGSAFGGGPTGSALSPTTTFYPTKYTVSAINKAMTGSVGDVSAHGPGYANSIVVGFNGVPICNSISPGDGKAWTYTTASTPNPCYDLELTSGGFAAGGDLSGSSSSQQVIGILGQALPSLSPGYPHWDGSAWIFDTPSVGGNPNGRVITSSTTAACGEFLRSDATSSITVTLPAVSTGCTAVVQRNGTGLITIDPNGATYDGVTTQLVQGTQVYIWTDGAGYHSTSPLLPGAHCTLTPGVTNVLDCTGGGGGSSSPPLHSVQYSDGAGGFGSDSTITIDPVGHMMCFGACPAIGIHIGPLGTATDWYWDTTDPGTAALALGLGTPAAGKYIDGGSGIWTPFALGSSSQAGMLQCGSGLTCASGVASVPTGGFPSPHTVNQTTPASEIDLTGCIDSSHSVYKVTFTNIKIAAGSGTIQPVVQFGLSGVWDTSSHYVQGRAYAEMQGGSASGTDGGHTTNGIVPSLTNGDTGYVVGNYWSGVWTLHDPLTAMRAGDTGEAQDTVQYGALSSGTIWVHQGGFGYSNSLTANTLTYDELRVIAGSGTGVTFTGKITCQPWPE